MTYADIESDIKKFFKGDVLYDAPTLTKYSTDASLFEVKPQIVVFPKDSDDLKALVKYVSEKKREMQDLSITMRSAGTDMSGGPLNDSIIADVTRYMTGIVGFESQSVTVKPGTFYRDFEKETLARGLILPSYTASKELNTVGGMVANNSAGEKTLRYGKTERYIEELKVILSDGNEYTVKPLTKPELDQKMAQKNFEGQVYRGIFDIVDKNKEMLAKAKPVVSKNSAGYYLWNVWDPNAVGWAGGKFDLNKLIVGSQGTLCAVTEAKLRLIPVQKLSKLFVIFMPSLDHLGEVVNIALKYSPDSIESYDDSTIKFAIKFFPEMVRAMKNVGLFQLAWSFWPEVFMVLRGGMPKLILMVEFDGNDADEIKKKMDALEADLAPFKFQMREAKKQIDSEKYWTIRRESFNLLRKHVRHRRTAPFIDDIIVPPECLPEFLPKMRAILDHDKLLYTIAGHAGDGNFHIIPLMDMHEAINREIIDEVSDKVYDLVISYHGSITAEHNDGIIRTPYLLKMFGPEIIALFQKTKDIFDPQDIFNPGKKVGGTKEYMLQHISRK